MAREKAGSKRQPSGEGRGFRPGATGREMARFSGLQDEINARSLHGLRSPLIGETGRVDAGVRPSNGRRYSSERRRVPGAEPSSGTVERVTWGELSDQPRDVRAKLREGNRVIVTFYRKDLAEMRTIDPKQERRDNK